LIGASLVGTVATDLNQLKQAGCARPCREIDDLKARANAGYALFAFAGAAAMVDIVLWVVASRHSRGSAR
jgi:hypothetical protein